jgi:glycosyltransferase involved in cell wall biosynthesis
MPFSAKAGPVKYDNITTDNTEFVLISFEGPDCYSMAGGLGVRMQNLARTLAGIGFKTHLFYIGDPKLPGEEVSADGRLILHRWCQWISRYYPGGVYDGEEGKLRDFTQSIPGYVLEKIVRPAVSQDKIVAVLGEEWQVAETVCHLSDVLYNAGMRDKVVLFWNANNTISFHRINWGRLNYATTITTISRYMKHIMERMGLNPLVIPNGIPRSLLRKADHKLAADLRSTLDCEILLCKVARWDPDKNWMEAVEAAARLKGMGLKTILLARGGREDYGRNVLERARSLGLTVKETTASLEAGDGYLPALAAALPADVIDIRIQLPLEFLAVMYRAADAVLANSGHEPFGIVGLEAMAAGGIVFTGSTGEDYSIPFVNSFMIETADPVEIVSHIMYLRNYPQQMRYMRNSARSTARYYTWEAAVQNLIGKLENQARIQGALSHNFVAMRPQSTPSGLIAGNQARQVPAGVNDKQPLNGRCLS